MALIYSSGYLPKIYPLKGDVAPSDIQRLQSIDPVKTSNWEKGEQIGYDGTIGYIKKTPTITFASTQNESGNFDFWRKLTNVADTVDTITLSDFHSSAFDIVGHLKDQDGNYAGVEHFPKLRTTGFTFTIGSPTDIIQRSFNFVGERPVIYQGNNKYFIYAKRTAESGESGDITMTIGADDYADYPTPILDPDTPNDNNSDYFIRIVRVRGSSSVEMAYGSSSGQYEYVSDTKIITFHGATLGDVYKVYYTASSYVTDVDPYTANTSDSAGILGDSVSIYLYVPASAHPASTDYIYRLQSGTIGVSLTREDVMELGNRNVVARSVNDAVVTVTLGRVLEDFTIEEVLAGQSADYGKLDMEKFTDQATLIVKVYEDYTKSTFSYGLKVTNLAHSESRGGIAVNANIKPENTLTSEYCTLTADEATLGI